jgi:hypothetical protein
MGEDADVLKDFGLIGHWALDCSKPASRTNPHSRFIITDGWPPVYEVAFGDVRTAGAWTVRDAHLIGDGRIGFELAIGVVTFANVVTQKANGRMRSMESTDGEGRQLVHEGRLSRTGQETPWLEKCTGAPIS